MPGPIDISEEILQLKRERRAILLAHHYQEPEIQELADVIGDSLELARKARDFQGDVIAFCGVWFMAETAKVLNPDRMVVVPDREASCSLVESCPAEPVREYRLKHPDHVIVSYINTSIEVKAESDILCTSRNAVQVVNSIPAEPTNPVPAGPNLGDYVKRQTGRENMRIWQGACIVHATFPARRVSEAKSEHPERQSGRASRVPADRAGAGGFHRLDIRDNRVVRELAGCDEFIVMTESGVAVLARRDRRPGKRFYFVANENCNCSECPYMKRNTLEKLRDCLRDLGRAWSSPTNYRARRSFRSSGCWP